MHSLVVGILTYQRPDRLCAGLEAVLPQVLDLHSDQRGFRAQVLVIDNDPAGSGSAVVRDFPERWVRYVHEPEPGIVAGRNRALDEAGDADLLVFIDDDEIPRPGWLSALVDTWCDTRPTAVMGRVYFNAPPDADPWAVAGGFFERARHPTGTEIGAAAAGNLLLDLRQVRCLNVRFDPRLGLSGGEDTLFTRQLVRRGGRIVWCDESVADDFVPAARATRQWVLQRQWRVGNCTALADLYLAETAAERCASRIRYTLSGSIRIAGGYARHALGRLAGADRHAARGLRTVRRGQGMLAGARGRQFEEYARASPQPDGVA